jgi:hypothetical protein
VPGALAAGTWQGENLIDDFLNRELEDREDEDGACDGVGNDGDTCYELGGSDTSENANPFTDGGTGDIGVSQEFMYNIDGDAFSVFADRTITDDDAGNTYVEMQDMWLHGTNEFDDGPEEIIGKLDFLAYTLKFDGPGSDELGIPECTEAEDQDFSACKDEDGDTDIDDATETHRVKVWFLGEEWIISEMDAPQSGDPTTAAPGDADAITSENVLDTGGSVKLAKEAVAGILNQGESLPVDGLKFQLDDLEAHGDTTSAIISILDANGNILKKEKVDPGDTQEFNIAGKVYRFHVYKVAPGYTFGAKWADVAIFAEELELVHGQELDQDEGMNEAYEVRLGWKNQDAATGVEDEGDPETVDTLRTIVIFTDDVEEASSSGEEELEEGDYVSIVQDPEVWKLSYTGLDLTSEDMHSLKFEIRSSDKTVDAVDLEDGGLDAGDLDDECTVFAPYIEVSSGDTGSVFEVDSSDPASTTLSDNEFFIALNQDAGEDGITCTDAAGSNDLVAGSILMKVSPTQDYGVVDYLGTGGIEVSYDDIGDGDDEFAPPEGGAILVQDADAGDVFAGDSLLGDLIDTASGGGGGVPDEANILIGIAEKAGAGSSNDFVDYWIFGVDGTDTGTAENDATFDFDGDDGGGFFINFEEADILYGHPTENAPSPGYYDGAGTPSGPVKSGTERVEENYVSARGSIFQSKDDDSIEFDMSHKLARAQWLLAPSATAAGDASKTIVTLGEGESTTVSGVTVKVLEITEDVGACSAGAGAVSCTADMSGVSAVIMPNNAPSVNVAMPYTGNYGNLVILDSDAVGVNTLVSVGGDVVNSVTADLLQGSAVDWTAERKVVREVVQGSKIVVAGREAADTLEAAQDFVNQVQKV